MAVTDLSLLKPMLLNRRQLAWAFGASAVLAALSLFVLAQATSVDANNWLIWARQAAIGNPIDMSRGITTFKALPVIWSLPFARVSPQLSDLAWMWLVRFSALSCCVLLFAISARRFGMLAGCVAAVLPLALSSWVDYAIAGDSEAVAAALALGAALAVTSGATVSASVLLALAALIRPEALGPLALIIGWSVLKRRYREAAVSLGCSSALVVLGWVVVPELVGQSFSSVASTAKSVPFVANSSNGVLTLLPTSIWLLTVAGLIGAVRRKDAGLIALLAGAGVWITEVAVMDATGISNGLDRYMIPAIVALLAVAGAGASTLCELAPRLSLRRVIASATAVLVVFLIGNAWSLNQTNLHRRQARADSTGRALLAFERAGGLSRWAGCVPFVGNGGYSLMVARRLGLPYSAFTTVKVAPALAFIPASAKSLGNGPLVTGGGTPRFVGLAKPDWVIAYYPAADRCGE